MLSDHRIDIRIDMAIAELEETLSLFRVGEPSKKTLARIDEALTLLGAVRDALRDAAEEERGKE